MEIRMGSLVRDAREATGTAIIIDVFRAFTTAAIAFDRGATQITLVAEAEDALELHRSGVGDLLMGEVDGKRPEGFDFGNSPFEISQADVAAAADSAQTIYLGSFVVAQATVDAIRSQQPDVVSIIAMGDQGRVRSDEDEQCGIYLRNIMEGRRPKFEAVKSLISTGGATQKFFDPQQPQYHPEDVDLALEVDRYAFAMRITREEGLLVARKELPG